MKKIVLLFFCLLSLSVHAAEVVVVGAGLAGLTAAYRLQQQGHVVEVYEARARPGGRICTAYFGDSHEELGGKNLIDGGEARTIRALIGELGLTVKVYPLDVQEGVFYFQNKAYLIRELMTTGPAPTCALYEELREKAAKAQNLAELVLPLFQDNPPLLSMIRFFITGYIGSPPEKLAPDIGEFWHLYSFFDPSRFKEVEYAYRDEVQGGNSCLIAALAQALHIHYREPLVKIAYDGKITLTFASGWQVRPDYVVIAMPASTLRDVTFEGNWLPSDQMEAIQQQQYGTNAKIVQPVQNYPYDPSVFSSTPRMGIWMNNQRNIMTWYYGGEAGCFDQKALPQVYGEDLEQAKRIYPQIVWSQNPPTPMKDVFMAAYEGPVGVSWINEPYSKGSYSNVSPEQYETYHSLFEVHGEKVRTVYRPFADTLFFAGEHTDVLCPSTMEGAVHSGEVAARMISKLWK